MSEQLPAPIAVQPMQELAFALTPQQILKQVILIQQVMDTVMRDGEHYGIIPGTEKKDKQGNIVKDENGKAVGKRTLFKPGAEKLSMVFGLSNRLHIEKTELPNGHREYQIICDLYDRAGTLRGQGVGLATTMEPKHRYRGAVGRKCPTCGAMTVKPSKAEYGGGYYCDGNKGGCGWKAKSGTKEAVAMDNVPTTRAENPDPAEQYNTILKMAKKRALVDAILTATAASDIFSQDQDELEDKIEEEAPAIAPQAARTAPASTAAVSDTGSTPAPQTAQQNQTGPLTQAQPAANVAPAATQAPKTEAPEIGAGKRLFTQWKAQNADAGKLMNRLSALYGGKTPQHLPPEKLAFFGKGVAELEGKAWAEAVAIIERWEDEAGIAR